ncbi:MAG: type II toxin-antitoxin system RelE/ParE family toxin [Candidatus Latescibacterota bacterium]
MVLRPVVPRQRANQDVEEALDHYRAEAGEQVAPGFVEALDRAYRRIARHPASGSPRYAHELDLPALRSWPLRRYSHLVFYVEREDRIDVWRVLHGERDIPAWMGEPNGPPLAPSR